MKKSSNSNSKKIMVYFRTGKLAELKKFTSYLIKNKDQEIYFDVTLENKAYKRLTLIDIAIAFREIDIIDFCLQQKMYSDNNGLISNKDIIATLLCYCIDKNNTSLLESLLTQYFPQTINLFYAKLSDGPYCNGKPFKMLAMTDNYEMLRFFIEKKVLQDFNQPIHTLENGAILTVFEFAMSFFTDKSLILMMSNGANPITNLSDEGISGIDHVLFENNVARASFMITLIKNKFIKNILQQKLFLSRLLANYLSSTLKFEQQTFLLLLENGCDLFFDLTNDPKGNLGLMNAYAYALCFANKITLQFLLRNYPLSAQAQETVNSVFRILFLDYNFERILFLDEMGVYPDIETQVNIEGNEFPAIVCILYFPELMQRLIIDRKLINYQMQDKQYNGMTPAMLAITVNNQNAFDLLLPYIEPHKLLTSTDISPLMSLACIKYTKSNGYYWNKLCKHYLEHLLMHQFPKVKEQYQISSDLSAAIIMDEGFFVFFSSCLQHEKKEFKPNEVEQQGIYKGFPVIAIAIELERKGIILHFVRESSIDWSQKFNHPKLNKTITVLEFFKQAKMFLDDQFHYDDILASIDNAHLSQIDLQPEEWTLERFQKTSSKYSFGELLSRSLNNYSIFRNSTYLIIANKCLNKIKLIIQEPKVNNNNNQTSPLAKTASLCYLTLRLFQSLYYYYKSVGKHEYAELMYKFRSILMWSNLNLPAISVTDLSIICLEMENTLCKNFDQGKTIKLLLSSNANYKFSSNLEIKNLLEAWENKYQKFILNKDSLDINLYFKSFTKICNIISSYITLNNSDTKNSIILLNGFINMCNNDTYDLKMAAIGNGVIIHRLEQNYSVSIESLPKDMQTDECMRQLSILRIFVRH